MRREGESNPTVALLTTVTDQFRKVVKVDQEGCSQAKGRLSAALEEIGERVERMEERTDRGEDSSKPSVLNRHTQHPLSIPPAMAKPVVVLDGGMSRELMRLNAPFRQPEWSALALIESPHSVKTVHEDYAQAGADVLTTNSYALVPFHINEDRFWKRGEELSALSGRLAREAADAFAGRKVAGSLPPMYGSYEPALFEPSTVQERLAVLVRGLRPYVDLWLGETLSLIAEAEAVRVAVKDSGKPLWIAFTLEDSGSEDNARLRSGESVVDAARWAVNAGVEALLFNCSRPEYMDSAVQDAQRVFMSEATKKAPLIGVYANAFEPKSTDKAANVGISSTREDLNAGNYIDFARQWVSSGASIVGGCCGIGVEHIKYISSALKQAKE